MSKSKMIGMLNYVCVGNYMLIDAMSMVTYITTTGGHYLLGEGGRVQIWLDAEYRFCDPPQCGLCGSL